MWLVTIVIGVLATGMVYQAVGARWAARIHAPPGVMIDADGRRLHAVFAGTGSPRVVFEAGVAASSLSWTRVFPAIAGLTRACAYDRAGLGWSDPPAAPRTVGQMLSELRAVVRHGGASSRAVLVGHSFGAFLVLAYAAQHPREVAGLVLLDPPVEWHDMTPRQSRLLGGGIHLSRVGGVLARVGVVRASLALLTGGAPGVPRHAVRVLGPMAARTLEHLVGEVRKLPPEVHPVVQTLWCEPKCFRAMAEHLRALPATAAAARRVTSLGDIPLVVISAGDQRASLVQEQQQIARLSSRGRHVVAPASGHWIQLDAPELVIAAISDVVGSLRPVHNEVA